jgi:predicted ABC-type ATPase
MYNADINGIHLFSNITDESNKINKRCFTIHWNKSKINKKSESHLFMKRYLYHSSNVDLVKKAREAGYGIISTFVYTKDPEINVGRVKERVNQGGHNVPEDKIISRYYKSLKNSDELAKLSDVFYKFDNSKNKEIVTDLGRDF